MKKIILGMVFVFATVTFVSANTSVEILENSKEIELTEDCIADAWEFGTWAGENDPYWEWYWTNRYYEQMC